MFKLIQQLLLVLLMSSILVGVIGCRSNGGAAATGTYAPYGSPSYTPNGGEPYSPGPTPPAAPPASSGGGSCPHCK